MAMANGQGRGPPRPKFSHTNLLKSKWDEHFRGVKPMQTPRVAPLHLTRPPPFLLSLLVPFLFFSIIIENNNFILILKIIFEQI